MRGMLLAAGRAERMEPLSSLVAKPALEVLGEPLLASGWRLLTEAGCTAITVNLHRHPDQVAAAARRMDGRGSLLRLSREDTLLGGAGGVAAIRPRTHLVPFLVSNADTWSRLDLGALLRAAHPETVHLALLPHPDPDRWRSVVLDRSGRVAAILDPGDRDPRTRFLFTGVQRLGEQAVAGLPEPPCEWAEIWKTHQETGTLFGAVVSGSWREAGDPESYRRLVLDLLPGQCSWTHPLARTADSAVIEHSAVGARCAVGPGAELIASVLTAGARVGPGCRLAGCVVAGRVTLEAITAEGQLLLPDRAVPLQALRGGAQN